MSDKKVVAGRAVLFESITRSGLSEHAKSLITVEDILGFKSQILPQLEQVIEQRHSEMYYADYRRLEVIWNKHQLMGKDGETALICRSAKGTNES